MRGKSNYTGPTCGSPPLPGDRHPSSTFSASTVEASSCADGWATYTSGGRLPAWYLAHARFLAALAAKERGPERPAAKLSTTAATLQRMKKCDVTRGGSIDCKIALALEQSLFEVRLGWCPCRAPLVDWLGAAAVPTRQRLAVGMGQRLQWGDPPCQVGMWA